MELLFDSYGIPPKHVNSSGGDWHSGRGPYPIYTYIHTKSYFWYIYDIYLHLVVFLCKLVGKYTVCPMDPSWATAILVFTPTLAPRGRNWRSLVWTPPNCPRYWNKKQHLKKVAAFFLWGWDRFTIGYGFKYFVFFLAPTWRSDPTWLFRKFLEDGLVKNHEQLVHLKNKKLGFYSLVFGGWLFNSSKEGRSGVSSWRVSWSVKQFGGKCKDPTWSISVSFSLFVAHPYKDQDWHSKWVLLYSHH